MLRFDIEKDVPDLISTDLRTLKECLAQINKNKQENKLENQCMNKQKSMNSSNEEFSPSRASYLNMWR